MNTETAPRNDVHAGPVRLLEGKVAIVTGASRGIGAVAARAFADAGAAVVLAARDEAALNAVAADITIAGGRTPRRRRQRGRMAVLRPGSVHDGHHYPDRRRKAVGGCIAHEERGVVHGLRTDRTQQRRPGLPQRHG